MAVHDERYTEDAVEDWVVAPRGRECRGGERDEPGGEQALECPVVRAVRARRRGERCRVVHGALDDGYVDSVVVEPIRDPGNVRPPGVYAYGALLVANRAVVGGQCAGLASYVIERTERRSTSDDAGAREGRAEGEGGGHRRDSEGAAQPCFHEARRRRLLPKPVPGHSATQHQACTDSVDQS